MSRRAAAPPGMIALVALLGAVHVFAQDPPRTVTAQEALAEAKAAYGPPDTRPSSDCPTRQPSEEIVVCAELEEQSQFRVRSSGDLDPGGAGARGGVPRAPDVGTVYPGVVVAKGCFIPPCPPPMAKIIDLKAIPEAPPGSDADRLARGLAPTGRGDPAALFDPPADAPPDAEEPVTPRG